MRDAKCKSVSFSSLGNMTSQNFPLRKGTSHQVRILTPRKIGLSLKKVTFYVVRIVLLDPKLTPHVNFSNIQAEENFSIFKIFAKLWRDHILKTKTKSHKVCGRHRVRRF